MDSMNELTGEKLGTKENSILNDIKQETRDTPGYKALTEEELMEKVETILLDKIKNGERKANFQLGLFYFEQGLYDKAYIYFERAKDYDFQAMFMLATLLYDGMGCPQDTKLAVDYLLNVEKSAARHAKHLVPAARFNIGRAYFQGYGVSRQSDSEAERYWLLAADDGNPKASVKAQTALGMFYSREDTLDIKKAFFWHSEACGNGSLESQGALGVMYEHGLGVRQCTDDANTCLKEASDRGNVYAMGNLVAQYYKRKLFTKASDLAARVSQFSDVELIARETDCLPNYITKGISMGCFYYARCLEEGHGVKKDKAEAQKYYSKLDCDSDVTEGQTHKLRYVCVNRLSIPSHGATLTTEGIGAWEESYVTTDPTSRFKAIGKCKKLAFQRSVENAFSKVILVVLANGKVSVEVDTTKPDLMISDQQTNDEPVLMVNELDEAPIEEENLMDTEDTDAVNLHILHMLEEEM